MVKRLLLITLIALLLLGAGLLIGGWWLLSTEEGARWLLAEVSSRSAVMVEAETVEGRLIDRLRLTGVRLRWPQGEARLDAVELRWRPQRLFAAHLAIDELTAQGGEIVWSAPPAGEAGRGGAFAWPRLVGWPLWLRGSIGALHIEGVELHPPEGETQKLERLAAHLEWRDGVLLAAGLEGAAAGYRLQGSAAAGFRRPQLRLDLQLGLPSAKAGMDVLVLHADLAPVSDDVFAGPLELRGRSGSELRLELTAELAVSGDTLRLRRFVLTRPGRPGTLSGAGEVRLAGGTPRWRLQAAVADFDLGPETGVKTDLAGTLEATGRGTDYRGRFELANRAPTWRSARLSGPFAGNAGGIDFPRLDGAWLRGTLAGDLRLAWRQGFTLTGNLRGRRLDPAVITPAWPGRINLDLAGDFSRPEAGPLSAHLRGRLIESTLRGRALTGSVEAEMAGEDLRLARLELHGDGFDLSAHGRLAERIAFRAEIARFSGLVPGAQGELTAQGWVRWSGGEPAGALDGRGRQLAYGDFHLGSLNLAVRLPGGDQPATVAADGSGIAFGSRRLQSVGLNLSGSVRKHAIDLRARWPQGELRAAAAGGWRGGFWRGTLNALDGRDAAAGPFRLTGPAGLEVAADRLRIASLRLAGRGSEWVRLDGNVAWRPWRGDAEAEWENLALARLKPWLPQGLDLDGRLEGKAAGDWLPGGQLSLAGEAAIDGGRLAWRTEEGELAAELRTARLDWQWSDETLAGELALALAEYGEVKGKFRLPLPARLPPAMNPAGPLRLELAAKAREQGLLAVFFPGVVRESRGELELRLRVGGTWQNPDLGGNVRLAGAGGYFPVAGIELREVALEGDLAGNELRIAAFSARSGPGRLAGSGSVHLQRWRPDSYRGTLKGERFEAVHLPELELLVTPDLTIEGTAERLQVRGEVRVPELRVLGREQRGVVRESPDVVVVGAAEPAERTLPLELDIRVHVVLGDQVLVKAAGVDARLTGELDLHVAGPESMSGRGEIRVAQGTYSTYGVKLKIVRGRLLYSGGPIDQPTLDILALRTVGEVKAGVQVGGTPRAPVVKLYSEPAMPDTDVLAYIVLGHPMGGDSGQAGALMAAASALLSRGESAVLQDRIKRRLGIDVLELESGGGEVAGSMVTIGKYLSPRLYLSFGKAFFTNTSEARLRYTISKKWELESKAAGERSGVDLYYKIEFD